jgi:hypothetical protein
MDAVRVSALVGKFKQIKEKITLEILFAIAGSWTRCVCLPLAGEFKSRQKNNNLRDTFCNCRVMDAVRLSAFSVRARAHN